MEVSTPLHRAAWTNENLAVLEALLAAGADIDAARDAGIAPIQNAAFANGNPAVIEALLAAGADRNTQSS
jgi:ankyrin repeat protein